MRAKLTRLLAGVLLAGSFVTGASLAVPAIAAASTCGYNYLIGPYVASNHLYAYGQLNCPSYGRGGDQALLQIIKVSTGYSVANGYSAVCGSGCDYHHINVNVSSASCSSSTYTQYKVWLFEKYDDKFGWGFVTGSLVVWLPCNV